MKYCTTNPAALVAAIALSLSGCGAPAAETQPVDKASIGEVKAALYGDTSSCLGASGGFNTVLPPSNADLNDGEADLGNRSSTCAAWVVTYDYTAPPTSITQYFWSEAHDMPTNEQDCVYSWTSDKVVGRHNGVYQTLHDLDSAFLWNGTSCKTNLGNHPPDVSGTAHVLRFDTFSSVLQDRLSYYNRIRYIAQPFWVYWAVKGRVRYFS